MPPPARDSSSQSRARVERVLQLLLIALAACAGNYARYILGSLQETIRVALALDDNQMALLQGPVLALPLVILSIPLGLIIDRYSRARLLRIFAFVSMVGSFFTALATTFTEMLLARGFVGLTSLAIVPVALSLISDIYPPSQRGRALMIVMVGQLGGVAGAFALGGKLLALQAPAAWQAVMLWSAAPLVPVAFLMLLMRDPPTQSNGNKNASISDAWSEGWRHRATTTPLFVGLVIMELTACATFTWTAPAFTRRFAMAPDRLGATIAMAVLVSGLVGPIVGGSLADVCQRTGGVPRTLSVMVVLVMLDAAAAVFPVLSSSQSATVVLFIFITVTTVILGIGTTVFTVVIPEHTRGLFTSVLNAGGIMAFGLAPMIVSGVSNLMGGPSTIARSLTTVDAGGCLLSAAVFAFAARYFLRASAQRSLTKSGVI
jgi:predicted MFS family arabinose efflux permease